MRHNRIRISQMRVWIVVLTLGAGVLLGITVPLHAVGQIDAQQATPKRVVLLLRNRNVIEGDLVAEGQLYRLRVSQGEVFIPQREVLAIADSVKALYEQERSRLFVREVEPHLELAIWCAEHGLEREAWAELTQARSIDPRHPGVPLATRRVEMALARKGSSDSPKIQQPQTNQPQTTSSFSITDQEAKLLANSEKKPKVVRPSLPRVPDPSELFRGLPQGTGEQFVRVIHPIVNHYCATAGCHGGPEMTPSLRLLRVPESRAPFRGEIAQNLQVVLSWIDFDRPGASPLLKAPTEPHGGLAAPVFSGTDMKQYRELVDWVYSVTRRPTLPAVPSEESNPDLPSTTTGNPFADAPGAGIPLDGAIPLFDPGVQQASHNSLADSSATDVVPVAGSLPIDGVASRQPTGPSPSKRDMPPENEQPLILPGQFLQPNPETIPAIRWTFDNSRFLSPQRASTGVPR